MAVTRRITGSFILRLEAGDEDGDPAAGQSRVWPVVSLWSASGQARGQSAGFGPRQVCDVTVVTSLTPRPQSSHRPLPF